MEVTKTMGDMKDIYIPVEIAQFFGLDGEEEPGPDGTTVVSVRVYQYREALIKAVNNLN